MRTEKSDSFVQALPIIIAVTTALVVTLFTVIGAANTQASSTTIDEMLETSATEPVIDEAVNSISADHASSEQVTFEDIDTAPQTDRDAQTERNVASPASFRPASAAAIDGFAENMLVDTPYLSFSARFPSGSHTQPVYRKLMREIMAYRDELRTEAKTEQKLSDNSSFRPWTVDIGFDETARAGDLISIIGYENIDAGGAHPNTNYRGVIAEVENGQELLVSDLFLPRKEQSPAFIIGICEAVKAAKIERIGSATIDGAPIECLDPEISERLADGQTILAPSTETGKFGGIRIYYAPYILGPYVEGAYTVTVTHEVFAEDLRPNYRKLFGGQPAEGS